tara:strand:- start:988 stop:1608 length:621 start_codon:yes stop_codon:yes gene_type:complete
MGISASLAELNVGRYQTLGTPQQEPCVPALWGFAGDAYRALAIDNLSIEEHKRAQCSVAILSGLYGLLQATDAIAPYRLEMGASVDDILGQNLYTFWGHNITTRLSLLLREHGAQFHLNLASREYSHVISRHLLPVPTIDMVFARATPDGYRVIGTVAKKLRGKTLRLLLQENINSLDALHRLNLGSHKYSPELSDASTYVYLEKA